MDNRQLLRRSSDLADDVDWAKVSDEHAFKVAVRLADWLTSSDCPEPLIKWFAGAVDRAEHNPRKFLAELGFIAEKRRPRAGVAWTARMIQQLVASGHTQSEAIKLFVDATYSARHPVSKRTVEAYLRKQKSDQQLAMRQIAIISALRTGAKKENADEA